MANYFLDTSALAKLYHQESGSEYMERIVTEPGSGSINSRLSIVETESVLAIKVRIGEINQPQAERGWCGIPLDDFHRDADYCIA